MMNTETPNADANINPDAPATETPVVETPAIETPTPTETDESKKEDPAATGDANITDVPDTYAAPEMPEGVVFDTELAESLAPLLKEKGVTQAEYDQMATALATSQAQAVQNQVRAWNEAVAKDPEINANDGAMRKAAIDAVGKYGSPELKTLFQTSGLGSQPDLVKLIGKLSLAAGTTEDRGTDSAATGGGQRTIEQRMYANK